MADKRIKRKARTKRQVRVVTERHHRIIWSRPSPNSVYKLAAEAMLRAENQVLESVMRRLARAEANGVSKMLAKEDILAWLDEFEEHIHWLRTFIREHKDVQDEIEEVLPAKARRQCDWCGNWFVPMRKTARFCQPAHRVAHHRQERRQQGLPYH